MDSYIENDTLRVPCFQHSWFELFWQKIGEVLRWSLIAIHASRLIELLVATHEFPSKPSNPDRSEQRCLATQQSGSTKLILSSDSNSPPTPAMILRNGTIVMWNGKVAKVHISRGGGEEGLPNHEAQRPKP